MRSKASGILEGCAAAAAAALELARANGDRRTAARARVVELRTRDGPLDGGGRSRLARMRPARPVLDELEALGDEEGMAAVLVHLGQIDQDRFERSSDYLERALVAAERAGDRDAPRGRPGSSGCIAVFGPVPAAEGIERCRALRERVADHAEHVGSAAPYEAVLHAMQGRIDEARALHAEADDIDR